jgi:hypothetical protein
VTSADASGNLNLQSGTTTILALTSTGVAITGTLSATGVLSATSPTFVTPVIDSATVSTVSGTAPLYMCRAWVNFNGTGTVAINASGNVSSITDNGTGDYTVNFTTAMVDANYSFITKDSLNNLGYISSLLAGSARFITTNGAFAKTDSAPICASVFR